MNLLTRPLLVLLGLTEIAAALLWELRSGWPFSGGGSRRQPLSAPALDGLQLLVVDEDTHNMVRVALE